MFNKSTIVWTFQHNKYNSPERRTFINGCVIRLMDDGTLYHQQSDTYSNDEYQTIDDITYEVLQLFIKQVQSKK